MIPKIIHYCWFGGNAKPDIVLKCIDSWKKYCPDYEIIEWNEENFDINQCQYCKEAYVEKKWAFVSDYARIKILRENGGVYIDTDVELVKPIDELLENNAFCGFELSLNGEYGVNTGSMLGSVKDGKFCIAQEELYHTYVFKGNNGGLNLTTCVDYTTELLVKHGLKKNNAAQTILDVAIFPSDYFCPLNMKTGKINLTSNTYSIHRLAGSWSDPLEQYGYHYKWECIEKYGVFFGKIKYFIGYSFYIVKNKGWKYFFKKIFSKV